MHTRLYLPAQKDETHPCTGICSFYATIAATMRQQFWRHAAPIAAPVFQRLPWRYRRAIFRWTNPTFLIGVAAVCLNENNEVLLLKHRFLDPSSPWGLPGGLVERGEKPQQGLRREVYEETGLQLGEFVPLHVDSDEQLVELFFLGRIQSATPRLQAAEVVDWVWCDLRSVDLPIRPSHREALRLAAQFGEAVPPALT